MSIFQTASSSKGGQEHTVALLRQENERLNFEINRLRTELSSSTSSSQVRELEIKLKTANSKIEELESQVRTYELQLRQYKDNKSMVSSTIGGDGQNSSRIQMTESQYSSSSSASNKYLPGGSTYQTPSYGQGTYTAGLSGSAVKDVSSTSYQAPTTGYGVTGSTSYGTTGVTPATTYGTTGVTGTTYGGNNLGTSGVSSGSKVGGQSSTYERKANLGSSGISGSGYSYQTKKP